MRRVVLRLPTCAFPPKSSSYKRSLLVFSNLDSIALLALVAINTSLVAIALVLISYLVYTLCRALEIQVVPL